MGRVFDLHQKNLINFKALNMLVMDEADKLLEDGNEAQLSHLLSVIPR